MQLILIRLLNIYGCTADKTEQNKIFGPTDNELAAVSAHVTDLDRYFKFIGLSLPPQTRETIQNHSQHLFKIYA